MHIAVYNTKGFINCDLPTLALLGTQAAQVSYQDCSILTLKNYYN